MIINKTVSKKMKGPKTNRSSLYDFNNQFELKPRYISPLNFALCNTQRKISFIVM